MTDRAMYLIQEVYETIVTPPTKPTKQNPHPPPPPAPYTVPRYFLKKRLDFRLVSGVSVSALADTYCVIHFYPGAVPYRPITPVPIKGTPNCMCCGVKLTPAAKKANCPGCGTVVCLKTCLVHTRVLPTLGYPKPIKVCPRCVATPEALEAQEDIILSSSQKSEIVAMVRKVYKRVMGSRIPINCQNTIEYQLAFEPRPRSISFQAQPTLAECALFPGLLVQAPFGIPQDKIATIEVQREERRKIAQERYKKEREEARVRELQREKEREEAHRKMVELRKKQRAEAADKAETERQQRENAAMERRSANAKKVSSGGR
eukprot:GDKK01023820.1.p1 GENE.GDKK01023820.1~~GDKK01023820.1.p1  ORF type:complete len:338 (+),score=58.69 GDKK01023820.1:65-1015(+)